MMKENQFNEYFQDFMMESSELLQEYEQSLFTIESFVKKGQFQFEHIEESIQSIFRAVHTIKSLAGMMEFHEIKEYAHEAEELLDRVRQNELVFDQQLIDALLHILDVIKQLIQNVLTPQKDNINLSQELLKLKESLGPARKSTEESQPDHTDNTVTKQLAMDVFKAGGEYQPAKGYSVSSTIRVDTKRLDDLVSNVGELVIGKNRLLDLTRSVGNKHKDSNDPMLSQGLTSTVDHIARLILSLQESTMKLRMAPIGNLFRKYSRLTRDLSKINNKEVQLEISGEETEIDRTIMEMIEDPLLHIIRNSVDHGIESPEVRVQNGKNSVGKITLSAFQENNTIVIRVIDDGRGMDTRAIYTKAVEKGFIEASTTMSEKDILGLIFLPGFSTAEKVTDVSGRGVGMDVVKQNILKINGLIDVKSTPGVGTTIELKVPLTLAIIQVLSAIIGEHRFSIPIHNVIETRRIKKSDIQFVNGHQVVEFRNHVLPLIYLGELLEVSSQKVQDKIFVVITGIAEKQIGLVVDQLTNQQDIVVKPIGNYLEQIHGISGATILGNGDISLVVDIAGIWERSFAKNEYEKVNQEVLVA